MVGLKTQPRETTRKSKRLWEWDRKVSPSFVASAGHNLSFPYSIQGFQGTWCVIDNIRLQWPPPNATLGETPAYAEPWKVTSTEPTFFRRHFSRLNDWLTEWFMSVISLLNPVRLLSINYFQSLFSKLQLPLSLTTPTQLLILANGGQSKERPVEVQVYVLKLLMSIWVILGAIVKKIIPNFYT